MKRFFCGSLAVALLWATSLAAHLHAQEVKPIIVVSVNSMKELLADGKFLEGLANDGQARELWNMAAKMADGVDQSKPAGGFFGAAGIEMKGLAFVPVTNFKAAAAAAAKAQGADVEDGENGIKFIGQYFAKEQDGYAFIAQNQDHLQNLPDPAKVLGTLSSKYDVAAAIHLQNIPVFFKQMGVGLIRQGLQEQLQQNEGETDAQFKMRKELAQQQIKLIEQLLEEVETVTFGLNLDRTQKRMFFDYEITAKPGSTISKQFAEMETAQTRFASLVSGEAPIAMNIASKITDETTIERAVQQLETYRAAVMAMIEDAEEINSDEERAIFKELASEGLSLVEGIYKDGRLDAAFALFGRQNEPFRLLGGLHTGNGKKLETFVRKVLNMAMEAEEDFPKVKFNVAKHKGASIHSLELPAPKDEKEAEQIRKFFGEKPMLLLAFSEDAAWMAMGSNPMDALKSVIENSNPNQLKRVKPVSMTVALIPFMKMSAEVDDNPIVGKLAKMMRVGTDRVSLTGEAIKYGVRYRLSVEEGVLKLISFGMKQATEGAGEGADEF